MKKMISACVAIAITLFLTACRYPADNPVTDPATIPTTSTVASDVTPTTDVTTEPTNILADPTVEPTMVPTVEPTIILTEPTAEPTEPSAAPVVPTTQPDDSQTEVTTEPTAEPTAPQIEATTAPTVLPTESMTEPATDPTENPTEPTEQPTEPTTESTMPSATSPTEHTHSFASTVIAPSCKAQGYTIHTCESCGYYYTDAEIPATDHDYELTKITQEPTCERPGCAAYVCKNCGGKASDSISPLGHQYELISDTATCGQGGTKTEQCSNCGHIKTSKSSATEHLNSTTTRVEPNCTLDGYIRVECTDCRKTISYTILDATGDCKFDKKMPLDQATQEAYEKGVIDYLGYSAWEDYDVYVCSVCGYVDFDTKTFRYTAYEAAEIMLGYVNELRESVGVPPLELDPTLVELTSAATEKWATTYGEDEFPPNSGAIGWDGGTCIRNHFERAVEKYYDGLVHKYHQYLGYGIYEDPYGEGGYGLWGMLVFWDNADQELYG